MKDGARGTIFVSTTITEALEVPFMATISTALFAFRGKDFLHPKHSFSTTL